MDIMCQMTGANPIRVSGIGARLSDEIKEGMYNYGQLQVVFDDGSVGWYGAGWGPMVSKAGFFLKEVFGPNGSVSFAVHKAGAESGTESLRIHHSELDENNMFVRKDEIIDLHDEPDHKELCRREQQYLLRAIREDLDLTDHINVGINSLRIVLAADESIKTGKTVELK